MPTNFDARLKTLLLQLKGSPETRVNYKYCLDFCRSCDARGMSIQTKIKILDRIKAISKLRPGKDFKKWDKKDVELVMSHLRVKYKPWTVSTFIAFFKSFWRFIFDIRSKDPAPKVVDWLVNEDPGNGLKKEDLLTDKEVQSLLDSTNNLQHKALISILCAGPRPRELLSITLNDVVDNGDILKVYVKAKPVKGKKETQRVIYPGFMFDQQRHREIIREWIEQHPRRKDKRAKLFDLSYANFRRIVMLIRIQADITKKFDLYRFRHTFGTWCYSQYNSAYARRLMGHAAGSKMEGVYCHLAEEDLEDMLLGRQPHKHRQSIESHEKFETLFMKFINEKKETLKAMYFEWLEKRPFTR